MFDGYKRYNNSHVFGAFVGIVGERHCLDSGEEGHSRDGLATAAEMESVIDRLANDAELEIGCVCTDNAGQCGRAPQILSLRYPSLCFLRCLSHQLNLVMGHVLQDPTCGERWRLPLPPPHSSRDHQRS